MKGSIMKCRTCGSYTLHAKCPGCGNETSIAGPMKYSTTDRFQGFRLRELEKDLDGKNSD
ncbi:MAG: ribosome biogenesis protein [Candidatus Thermoplasmatota archaeon]|jgi:rRNA maturation protein Nop10|nr:ribosome biogenesis protein [Candidatus Thermoplasmatota archaeon]